MEPGKIVIATHVFEAEVRELGLRLRRPFEGRLAIHHATLFGGVSDRYIMLINVTKNIAYGYGYPRTVSRIAQLYANIFEAPVPPIFWEADKAARISYGMYLDE
jgi:hypothetical protein